MNHLGSENGQKSIGGNFRYARGLSMVSDDESDSDETSENRSYVSDSNSGSDGSDASVHISTEDISEDEFNHSDNEEVEDGVVDINNGEGPHESIESDDEPSKHSKYVGTSDRVLRLKKNS